MDVVRICGSVSGREPDEFEKAGVTPQEARAMHWHLIAGCPVSIECPVVDGIDLRGAHRWFIGEMQAAYIYDDYKPAAPPTGPVEPRGVFVTETP